MDQDIHLTTYSPIDNSLYVAYADGVELDEFTPRTEEVMGEKEAYVIQTRTLKVTIRKDRLNTSIEDLAGKMILEEEKVVTAFSLKVAEDGRIGAIYALRNPDKLKVFREAG